jgi:hypothetical protein
MARTSAARKTISVNPRHHYVMGSGAVQNRLQVKWHPGKRTQCKICLASKNGNAPPNNIPLPRHWFS